jgi:hypothetical protein
MKTIDPVEAFSALLKGMGTSVKDLSPNDVARLNLWDLAVMTANVGDIELATWPMYTQIFVRNARKAHAEFDPAWRKANGYPEVI